MYLWKIKLLKEEIRKESVSRRDYKLYEMAFLSLYTLLFILAIIQIYTVWNILMVGVQVLVSGLGIYYSYFLNGGSKGVNFKNKFFSVGWVFLLRSVFFMSIGMLNLYVMTYSFSLETLFSIKNSIIIGLLFEILLYWRIAKHIETLKST
jgi:hypothetical protein